MKSTEVNWSGSSKKTITERLEHLENNHLSSTETLNDLRENALLSLETANQLTENVLGTFFLPFSVVPNFQADGATFNVPMATGEPSVVAVANFVAKIIKHSGGLKTKVHSQEMIGQVAFYDMVDKAIAKEIILNHSAQLLTLASEVRSSVVKRSGGTRELTMEERGKFLIVYLTVDTQGAMGADMVNTMMEALVPSLEELSGGKTLMTTLSNYVT